jgi:hypothetical protein
LEQIALRSITVTQAFGVLPGAEVIHSGPMREKLARNRVNCLLFLTTGEIMRLRNCLLKSLLGCFCFFGIVANAHATAYVTASTRINIYAQETVYSGAHLLQVLDVSLNASCNGSAYAYISFSDKELFATALTVSQGTPQYVRIVYHTGETSQGADGSGSTTCRVTGIFFP